MNPEAVAAIASKIQREWGYTGYTIVSMSAGPAWGSAVALVRHSDWSEFAVGADRYGNTHHGDTIDTVRVALAVGIYA